MSIGFVQTPFGSGIGRAGRQIASQVAGGFRWLGQQVSQYVNRQVEDALFFTGNQIVNRAQQLAPVDTGRLRQSIGFLVSGEGLRRTLTITVDAPYGIFQEFGTRNIPPHPFVRPALNDMMRLWGMDVQMSFSHAGPSTWQGIHYAHHRNTPGYVIPSAIQPRPLNARQRSHVANRLQPSAARLHRGNVRRAKMVVRHSY